MEHLRQLKSKESLLLAISITLAFAGYGLGKLSRLEEQKSPIQVLEPRPAEAAAVVQVELPAAPPKAEVTVAVKSTAVSTQSPPLPPLPAAGGVIGVKTSKKYYFPWCHPIPRLKETNAVPFASIEEARAAGYVPAKNCKGLQ